MKKVSLALIVPGIILMCIMRMFIIPVPVVYAEDEVDETIDYLEGINSPVFDPLDCTPFFVDSPVIVGANPESEYRRWEMYTNYDEEEIRCMNIRYESTVAGILSEIKDTWTDEEILFYLHDYITSHAEYDHDAVYETNAIAFSSYGNLVLHKSVCEGYSRAFYDLANRAGVETYIVTSELIDHGWNLSKIDGKFYYIDCTWDGQENANDAYHTFFLKSQDYFYENRHNTNDWLIDSYWNIGVEDEYIFDEYNNKKYDDAVWNRVNHPVVLRDGYILYNKGGVHKYTGDPNSSERLRALDEYGFNSHILSVKDKIFVNSINKVFLYSEEDNTLVELYEMPEDPYSNFLDNIHIEGNRLYYSVINNYALQLVREGFINIKTYIGDGEASIVSFDTPYQCVYEIGKEYKITPTISPAEITVEKWESTDPNVATVDNAGNVKVVGYGSTFIKAYSGNKQAWCCVVVPKLWFEQDSMNINRSEITSYLLTVSAIPEIDDYFPSDTLIWSSSDESVIRLNGGKESTRLKMRRTSSGSYVVGPGRMFEKELFIGKAGSSDITVSTPDGKISAVVKITVEIQVKKVWINRLPGRIMCGEQLKCTPGYTPDDPTGDVTPTWSSSDPSVVTVDSDGTVTGISKGNAEITLTIQGVSCTREIEVYEDETTPINKKYIPSGIDKNLAEGHCLMYRLYNPNTGEHFYTGSKREGNKLVDVGWNYEGIAWEGPVKSNTPVYRLYNPNVGEHHYTPSKRERDNLIKIGWNDEGIGWYSDDNKGKPLYRLYNPNATTGNHHYTTSTKERDKLVKIGWNDEGIGWYGY